MRRRAGEVLPIELEASYAVKANAFGPPNPKPRPEMQTHLARRRRERLWWVDGQWSDASSPKPTAEMLHLAEDAGAVVAMALSFVRTVRTGDASFRVLALAGVVSDPAVRGRGFGQAVIRDAFARLEEESITHCLFQTGEARGLYEKMGGAVVGNRFVDRTAAERGDDPEARPWDDEFVMRYPASAGWPDGVIDLNGPGY